MRKTEQQYTIQTAKDKQGRTRNAIVSRLPDIPQGIYSTTESDIYEMQKDGNIKFDGTSTQGKNGLGVLQCILIEMVMGYTKM